MEVAIVRNQDAVMQDEQVSDDEEGEDV